LGWLLVRFGFVPPPHAAILIRIRGGELHVSRGRVRAQTREFVLDILSQAAVTNGFIAVTPGNWVVFSRQIPRAVHQRLRNVLLNF
jgi:hypothetical protein